MKIHLLGPGLEALVFDIDNTLYRNPAYTKHQTAVLVEELARRRGLDLDAMKRDIDAFIADFRLRHEERTPSLGNTFLHFGIPISESVRMREELIRPEDYLEPDVRLAQAFSSLAASFRIAAVTNNPVSTGRRTLEALGVGDFFPFIVGLDTTNVSKPAEEPFRRVLELLGAPAEKSLSIGDRFEVDLEIPLRMGMSAILVESMEDVYTLPGLLHRG